MRWFLIALSLLTASPVTAAILRPTTAVERDECYYFLYRYAERNYNRDQDVCEARIGVAGRETPRFASCMRGLGWDVRCHQAAPFVDPANGVRNGCVAGQYCNPMPSD
jgi:hypothetical protein